MYMLIAVCGISFLLVVYLLKLVRDSKEALAATRRHCDLGSEIMKAAQDPHITSTYWINLLPECRGVDGWFAKTHPGIEDFLKTEELVKLVQKIKN